MSSTVLKLIALALMFLDHVGQFIPGAPLWLHWVGRISAPLFMYCMVWGLHYTHDRRHYFLRLYLFGVCEAFMNLILNQFFGDPYCEISNNIFVTLFLGGVIILIYDLSKGNRKLRRQYWAYFLGTQFLSTMIIVTISSYATSKLNWHLSQATFPLFLGALLPNIFFNEGNFVFVGLIVLLYFVKEDKKHLLQGYGGFCLCYFLIEVLVLHTLFSTMEGLIYQLFHFEYQWMMIGALPLMLLYNGKKGKGLKYLFYLFYPIHIALLFLVGNFFF